MSDYAIAPVSLPAFNDVGFQITITATGALSGNVTLSDGSSGGTFDAASYAIAPGSPATATYTPSAGKQGTVGFTSTNDFAGDDPAGFDAQFYQPADSISASATAAVVGGTPSTITLTAKYSGATGPFIAFRAASAGTLTTSILEGGQVDYASVATADFDLAKQTIYHPGQAGVWTMTYSSSGGISGGTLSITASAATSGAANPLICRFLN